jgi:hypothetical protein
MAAVLAAMCAPPVCAAPLESAAGKFLAELDTPDAARKIIIEKLSAAAPRESRYAIAAESGGVVYGFSSEPAPYDHENDVRLDLESAACETNSIFARRALLVCLNRSGIDKGRYRYDEALGDALSSYYRRRGVAGIQSASDVTDGWVFALVWIENAGVPRAASSDIEEDYCAFLYARAKREFDAKRYGDALPVFKHIHDHRWANIGAYLDASECFLKNGEPGESRKLLSELVAVLGEIMTSDDFARAGRLFRESGDRASALSAFKAARERFHEGK